MCRNLLLECFNSRKSVWTCPYLFVVVCWLFSVGYDRYRFVICCGSGGGCKGRGGSGCDGCWVFFSFWIIERIQIQVQEFAIDIRRGKDVEYVVFPVRHLDFESIPGQHIHQVFREYVFVEFFGYVRVRYLELYWQFVLAGTFSYLRVAPVADRVQYPPVFFFLQFDEVFYLRRFDERKWIIWGFAQNGVIIRHRFFLIVERQTYKHAYTHTKEEKI